MFQFWTVIIVYLLVLSISFIFSIKKDNNLIKAVTTLLLIFGFLAAGGYCWLMLAFSYAGIELVVYSCTLFALEIILFIILNGFICGYIKNKRVITVLIILLCAVLVSAGGFYGYQKHVDNLETVAENDGLIREYMPNEENTKAVSLNEPSTLFIDSDMPVMDGATALFPIYSSFAKAIYPEDTLNNLYGRDRNGPLKCSTTTWAYQNLMSGWADIIFVAGPSEQQLEAAQNMGIELNLIPIGREGFVFFVNSKNPLDNITLEQIRGIYSGKITEWSELAVKRFGKIRPFQREEGSGSQTALQSLMTGETLIEPPTEDRIDGMGGIITRTADYKNYKNAIGYSFRFYSTEMVKNDSIKLLSINGVYPSAENIENGTYPLASEFYAITTQNSNPKCADIINWILSDQGREIIEKTGYTPLNKE